MKIVKFDKQVVSVGLNWHWVEEDNNRKALIKAFEDEVKIGTQSGSKQSEIKKNIKKACLVRHIDMASIGFWVENGKGMKGGLGPSGAALLALANQERINGTSAQSSGLEDDVWLLIERLTDDEYWIVFINKGLPMPGGDILSSKEGVRSFLSQDALQEMPMKLFTTDADVQDYAPPKAQVVSSDFVELIKNIKPSKGQLKPVSGIDPMIVVVLLGFVLVVGGFFGWSWYDKNQKQKAAAAAAAQQAQAQAAQFEAEKRGYVESVQQAVLTALDQGVASVDAALAAPAPQEVVNAWLELIESVPLEHSGFDLSRVECALETPEQPICTVYLTRGPWGINRIFLQDFPQATLVGNEATYVLRGPLLIKKESNWKPLPSADRFNIGLVSDLQIINKTGISFNQTASQDIVQKIEMPQPPANVLSRMDPNAVNVPPAPVNLGVAKGQLSLSGTGLWQPRGFNVTLDRPGLNALTLNVTLPAQTWQMQVDYYIRTRPSPELPVVIGPDGPITTPFPEKYRHLTAGEATGALTEVSVQAPVEAQVTEESATVEEGTVDEDIQIGLPDAGNQTRQNPQP